MRKRQLIIIGTSLFLVIGSIALYSFLGGLKADLKKETTKQPKKYVKTKKVIYNNIPTFIIAYGRVTTSESLDLIAEKNGRMYQKSTVLKEGREFKKGDLLFKIDSKEAYLALQSQKSNFLKDLAAILPDFRVDFPNEYKKWSDYFESIDLSKNIPTFPDLHNNKEKIYLATKNIFSSYYTIKSIEESLTRYHLFAPFNGIISQVLLQTGSYVSPGSKIAKIYRTDSYEIKVAIEITDIEQIKKGVQVELKIENSNETCLGRVARIGKLVNAKTQSIDVFITLKGCKGKIFHGMYLESIISGKEIKEAMEIPRRALFNTNEVYLVEDSFLVAKKVNILKTNTETVIINGVELGKDLVYEPLVNAHNGMIVYRLSDKKLSKK